LIERKEKEREKKDEKEKDVIEKHGKCIKIEKIFICFLFSLFGRSN